MPRSDPIPTAPTVAPRPRAPYSRPTPALPAPRLRAASAGTPTSVAPVAPSEYPVAARIAVHSTGSARASATPARNCVRAPPPPDAPGPRAPGARTSHTAPAATKKERALKAKAGTGPARATSSPPSGAYTAMARLKFREVRALAARSRARGTSWGTRAGAAGTEAA